MNKSTSATTSIYLLAKFTQLNAQTDTSDIYRIHAM